jgi:signal transduction histidine kinase
MKLEGINGGIRLCIENGGEIFDPEQKKGRRELGLVSMEERVRLVDGTLSIKPRAGGGMQIDVWIPLAMWERNHEKTACPLGG